MSFAVPIMATVCIATAGAAVPMGERARPAEVRLGVTLTATNRRCDGSQSTGRRVSVKISTESFAR